LAAAFGRAGLVGIVLVGIGLADIGLADNGPLRSVAALRASAAGFLFERVRRDVDLTMEFTTWLAPSS
jgi:hypothetical protein